MRANKRPGGHVCSNAAILRAWVNRWKMLVEILVENGPPGAPVSMFDSGTNKDPMRGW